MKTKQSIYFLLMATAVVIIGIGGNWVRKEYALCTGIVLLMFGVYKYSRTWKSDGPQKEGENDD